MDPTQFMDVARSQRWCARTVGFDEKSIYYKCFEDKVAVIRLHDKAIERLDNSSLKYYELKVAIKFAGQYLLDAIDAKMRPEAEFKGLTLERYDQMVDSYHTLHKAWEDKQLEGPPKVLAIMSAPQMETPPPDNPPEAIESPAPEIVNSIPTDFSDFGDMGGDTGGDPDEQLPMGGSDIEKILSHHYRKHKDGAERLTFKITIIGVDASIYSPEWELDRVLPAREHLKEYIKNVKTRGRNTLLRRYPELLNLIKN